MIETSTSTYNEQIEFLTPLLMPRDRAILKTIAFLAPVSRKQIQRLHFPCSIPGHFIYCSCEQRTTTAVSRRLAVLRNRKIVKDYRINRRITTRTDYLSNGHLYIMNPGYEKMFLETRLRFDNKKSQAKRLISEVNKKHKRFENIIQERDFHLMHRLFINDIYAWFRLSERRAWKCLPGLTVSCKLHENVARLELAGTIPDATFTISFKGKKVTLYVEADRATETIPCLTNKFSRYSLVLKHPEEQILIFLVDRNRRLTRDLVSLANRFRITKEVWFGIYDQYEIADNHFIKSNALLDPVWFTCDMKQRSGLSNAFGLRQRLFPESFRR